MSSELHVISFDNPFPPNYGGVIDVYYKLKALKEAGFKTWVHVFEYGRSRSPELQEVCENVTYYPRRTFVNPFIGTLPYIVSTRNDMSLLHNLCSNSAPILFEGLHSCFFLDHPSLSDRIKLVRMHNIEHDYYRKLEEVENNFFKKYFFAKEADRLEKFEQILHHADHILAISPNDALYLSQKFQHVHLLPAFHANNKVSAIAGKGNYALYHGKLSVGENDEAARYLVTHVFNDLNVPLVIAGNNPSALLKKLVDQNPAVTLHQNITTEKINELTREAQVNVLPTFQSTGIKLKLINVLYQGRWAVVNKLMVDNTGLQEMCTVADNPADMKAAINRLMQIPFSADQVSARAQLLEKSFSNRNNIEVLKKCISLSGRHQ